MPLPSDRSSRPGVVGLSSLVQDRRWATVCACLLVVVFGLLPLAGKEKKVSRTVHGTVLDEANNGIAGATVSLTDLQSGKKLATYTKDDGQYQYSDLIPNHDYELQASYKGVLSEVRKVSSVDTRNRIVINFTFPPPKS